MADTKENGKQYGLVLPKKRNLSAPKATNVFANEEESGDEDGTDWVKKALRAECEKNRAKKQTRLNIQKALDEDPTICQYDEVFDDMKCKEEHGRTKNGYEVKKAKYIDELLKTANRRKKEQEHRIERQVQKEREADGAMYADKESFVTSTYRAKLEEFKRMEKEEENADRLESIGDVTKQRDMSGFYRHFFSQTVDGRKSPKVVHSSAKKIDVKDKKCEIAEKTGDGEATVGSTSLRSSNDERQMKESNICKKSGTNGKNQNRRYRRRVVNETSESESEIEEPEVNEEVSPKDNDRIEDTIDELSEPVEKMVKGERDEKSERVTIKKSKLFSEGDNISTMKSETRQNTVNEKGATEEEQGRKKISIWEKRTVGPVFQVALQRYYERKAMRLSGF